MRLEGLGDWWDWMNWDGLGWNGMGWDGMEWRCLYWRPTRLALAL